MKSFLEEYGFAILAAIVVILIIALCTPVGNLIKRQVMNVVDSFAGKSQVKLATTDAGEDSVQIKQIAEGKIEVIVTSNSTTDEFDVQYRVKADKNAWQNWTDLAELKNNESKNHKSEYEIEAQDGYSIQVRAKNIGKNDNYYMESNVIRYSGSFITLDNSGNNSPEPQVLDLQTQTALDQTELNEAIANLTSDQSLYVVRGNGGRWPNGETLIFLLRDSHLNYLDSYPSFDNENDFFNYEKTAEREGLYAVEALYDWETSSGNIEYYNVDWREFDNEGIIIPLGNEIIEIYYGNGGTLPNGDEIFWEFWLDDGDYSSDYYSNDSYYNSSHFSKDGYIRDQYFETVSTPEEEANGVFRYRAIWMTESECLAKGTGYSVVDGRCELH